MLIKNNKNKYGFNEEYKYWPLFYLCITFLLSIFIFYDGLAYMLQDWQREEFSHGYMIPFVSLFLLLQKLPELKNIKITKAYLGIVILLMGIFLYILGELSAIYTVIQYGYILVLLGVGIALLGIRSIAVIGVPIAFLLFMIPLPNFLYFNLSSNLQLLSSEIGVYILRLLNVSVFLEGNVIDLGSYRLQVVDACSGLHYLFPLMSFGFLVAYLYKSSFWKKSIVFISTIPITIFMNSFRIAIVGVTVNIWGLSAAEGFVHDFQGWVVFIVCLLFLALEIIFIHRLSGNTGSPLDSISLELPKPILSFEYFKPALKITLPALILLLILVLSAPLKLFIAERNESIPVRSEFNTFPLSLGTWIGREGSFNQDVLDTLKFKDYFVADYVDTESGAVINLYIAYYDSQRKGASIHSPKTCMPGGGWEITAIGQQYFNNIETYSGKNLQVNRAVIQKDSARSLVYYWFQQRGRIITNEYMAKWYIFTDALSRNRTDGALIRLTVDYSNINSAAVVEQRLQDFVGKISPLLPQYIPE